jgi:hypothetical protein
MRNLAAISIGLIVNNESEETIQGLQSSPTTFRRLGTLISSNKWSICAFKKSAPIEAKNRFEVFTSRHLNLVLPNKCSSGFDPTRLRHIEHDESRNITIRLDRVLSAWHS